MKWAFSLRVRVAAATALATTIIVVALGITAVQALDHYNLRQIDQRLETTARLVLPNPDLAARIIALISPANSLSIAIRAEGKPETTIGVPLPELPTGTGTVTVSGEKYRVYTATAPRTDETVSLALPVAEAEQVSADQRRKVGLAGLLAIAAAAGLGWLLGGRAVAPLVRLTHLVNARPPQAIPPVSGVREATELAAAVNDMLQRVSDAQGRTEVALATARDFAAAAAHELRTPLTAARTDIEVLRTLDLDERQRSEILDDLQRTQGRVEATLTALEKLASGELSREADQTPTDIAELCDLAAQDAMRHFPQLHVTVEAEPSVITPGLPAGLRLAVDNALANAARHGGATNVVLAAIRRADGGVTISIDDDGRGIAPAERAAVFERFRRGAGAAPGGSGLGLALVAQQAELHAGRAYFEDGRLGGARLVLELWSTRPPNVASAT